MKHKYAGLTEDEFVEAATAMPNAHKYDDRGQDYNEAAGRYYMKHGSASLRKELRKVAEGRSKAMPPSCLEELSRLGQVFDAEWILDWAENQ